MPEFIYAYATVVTVFAFWNLSDRTRAQAPLGQGAAITMATAAVACLFFLIAAVSVSGIMILIGRAGSWLL